jgi:hypothetical protein
MIKYRLLSSSIFVLLDFASSSYNMSGATNANVGGIAGGNLERRITNRNTGDNANGILERQLTFKENIRRRATNSGQYYPNEKNPGSWPNNLVGWNGPDDPQNPMNWPTSKKIGCTVILGFTTMGAAFASSSFSPTFDAVSAEFGVSTEVTTLSLSLFVLGFAFGPLVNHPVYS